jgi:hypothetical protein
MTELLKQAMLALEQLPETEQDAVAQQILVELAKDAKWDATLNDPKGLAVLDALVTRAKKQVAQGGAEDIERL